MGKYNENLSNCEQSNVLRLTREPFRTIYKIQS